MIQLSRVAAGFFAAALLLSGCSDKKWSAQGTVASGKGLTAVVEAPNAAGGWYAIDTVEISRDGQFAVSGAPFGHPQLLRMTIAGTPIYFPIDSLETVTITTDASDILAKTRLSGSPSAEKMQQVNDLIAQNIAKNGADAVASDAALKRTLAQIILQDPSDIVAYYLVFHKVGSSRLFSPEDRNDLRVIGAVANAYTQKRPTDPRTALLKNLYLQNRRVITTRLGGDTIVAAEVGFPEVSLLDEKGARRALSAVADGGKVVIVSFTDYSLPISQALNVELNKVYEANKASGLEIYQIGIDGDEFQWKQSAKNLPWVTVYNAPGDGGQALIDYNVGAVPALFVINRRGELVERVEDPAKLSAIVGRYL